MTRAARPPSRRQFLAGLPPALGMLGIGGCRRSPGRPVAGFAQMDSGGAWRIAETRSMREAAEANGFELVVTDAQDQTAKQVSDVEDLIARRVRALFVAPRDFNGMEPAFEAARHGVWRAALH